MKNKYANNTDEENEFDVDEPEEIQNNASDDDWTPDKDDASGGRRTSTRLRNIPKSRAPIIDASSSDDENSEDSEGGKRKSKKGGRGRPVFYKKQKVSSTTTSPIKVSTENGGKSANSDSEPTSTTTNTTSNTNNTSNNSGSPAIVKVSKEFTSGAFVVLKTDAANLETDPPLWKIDGKALLQKYIPFEMEGQTFYKNTSVYSGWTINNKDNYYPVSVIFKQQTRKEHVVEFHRDQIKFNYNDDDDDNNETPSSTTCETVTKTVEPERPKETNEPEPKKPSEISKPVETPAPVPVPAPVIKVKSFAIVKEVEETKTPPTPVVDKPVTPEPIQYSRTKAAYTSGSFLVLRTDAANVDPPLWKIDGKALLQKYSPFYQNGKTLYKNSAEYSGWAVTNKKSYFSASVQFKQQNKKDHIVELDRIKWDEPDDSDNES